MKLYLCSLLLMGLAGCANRMTVVGPVPGTEVTRIAFEDGMAHDAVTWLVRIDPKTGAKSIEQAWHSAQTGAVPALAGAAAVGTSGFGYDNDVNVATEQKQTQAIVKKKRKH